jgi:hypothetical protein
LHYCHLLGI